MDKNKLNDPKWYGGINFIENNWKSILILVSFSLFLLYLIFSGIFPHYDPHDTNGNTLNIISLLVQSEAAIIAIVITLSLVAVQLASQSYSTRIIEIFERNNTFRAIVALYISIIIIGVITLILADNGIAEIFIKKLLLINYCISVLAFISLIPFIWLTFNLLKPFTILEELSKDIKKEKILKYINNKQKEEDPIQPIIDVIHSSCIKNDYASFKKGLNLIHDSIAHMVNEDELNHEKIIIYLLDHYKSMGMVALTNNDEKYITQIIIALYLVGKDSAEEKLKDVESKTMGIIGDIGKITASKFENSTADAAKYLKEIYVMSLEHNEKISLQHVNNLGHMGQIALERKFDLVADIIIDMIEEIANESFKQDNQNIIDYSLLSLRRIGKTALEQELDLTIEPTIKAISRLGIKVVEKYEESTEIALYVLTDICIITLDKRLESRAVSSILSFKSIGEEAITKNKETTINNVLFALYRVGDVALEHNIKSSVNATLESLETIGNNLIEQGMGKLAVQTVNNLQELKEIAEKNKLKKVCKIIENSYVNMLKTAKKKKQSVEKVIDILEDLKTSKTP